MSRGTQILVSQYHFLPIEKWLFPGRDHEEHKTSLEHLVSVKKEVFKEYRVHSKRSRLKGLSLISPGTICSNDNNGLDELNKIIIREPMLL